MKSAAAPTICLLTCANPTSWLGSSLRFFITDAAFSKAGPRFAQSLQFYATMDDRSQAMDDERITIAESAAYRGVEVYYCVGVSIDGHLEGAFFRVDDRAAF